METKYEQSKSADISIKFCEFEMPPMQDLLIVGRSAPIGPEAARRMADILSPDQYDIIRLEHDKIEAIVARKTVLRMIPTEKLLSIILDEVDKFVSENSVYKANIDIVINVKRSIEI
ncbi:MAG: hypothetical protein PWR27_1565 [Petroclostridium sp.]|jgi:hypothetical protein|uniref:hypothetical protein n=1 Tax=Petroclostridium xylanilyticum TaxID=1792311 RepID=UPI000B981E57|nr:hypothetical protein [Petroclostridium xylanilyticum]MBZ4645509.1 hypothetical protein [Clostridia bacterium]MDK2810856.1 hypothetical protein [Petroclostridium sp.]